MLNMNEMLKITTCNFGNLSLLYHFFFCGSTVLLDSGRLTYRRFLELFRHMVGLLGRVISPSQVLCLHRTTQHRNTRKNIHALSGIRTHDYSNQPAKTHASDRTAAVTGTVPWNPRKKWKMSNFVPEPLISCSEFKLPAQCTLVIFCWLSCKYCVLHFKVFDCLLDFRSSFIMSFNFVRNIWLSLICNSVKVPTLQKFLDDHYFGVADKCICLLSGHTNT
jgi:hypothetical protein